MVANKAYEVETRTDKYDDLAAAVTEACATHDTRNNSGGDMFDVATARITLTITTWHEGPAIEFTGSYDEAPPWLCDAVLDAGYQPFGFREKDTGGIEWRLARRSQ